MRRLTLILLLVLVAPALVVAQCDGNVHAGTYYVDNACSSNGNGSSVVCGANGPFNSIANMQAKSGGYAGGNYICLKRGQTYRETLEDALDWARYRAYEHGDDARITSTDGGVDWTIACSGLSFRVVWGDEETIAPTREEALAQGRRLAEQPDGETLVYDYNEKLLARFVQRGSRLFEEFYPSDRIAISRDICMGAPRIAGTHIQVWVILDLVADGWTPEEIVEDYEEDNITVLDVVACLEYASKVLRGLAPIAFDI